MIYLDSFLKVAKLEGADISATLSKLETIGEKYHVTFVLSISMDPAKLPEDMKSKVIN